MTIRRGIFVFFAIIALALATIQFWIAAFIFRPTPLHRTEPDAWGITNAVAMKAEYGDGTEITGWWHPPAQPIAPVVLIAHGRSANISSRASIMQRLAVDGMGVLLFDYRGYGASSGQPDEENLDQDILTAYRWIRAQGIPAEHIVVIGQSLGNGPASMLAAKEPVGGLVLVSPFTNLPDALAERLPWLPVRLLPWGRNRFDVENRLRSFDGPILLVASKNDGMVPADNSRKLQTANPALHWLDVSPLQHDGMLEAIAKDGRLTNAIRALIPSAPSASRASSR